MWPVFLLIALLLIIAARSVAAAPAAVARASALIESTWGNAVDLYAGLAGVPRLRVKAMIIRESMGNPLAPGAAGERGLMQIQQAALIDVKKNFGVPYSFDDMWKPLPNIHTGTLYLKLMLRRFGNIDLATQAYNAGPGRLEADPSAGFSYLQGVKEIEKIL